MGIFSWLSKKENTDPTWETLLPDNGPLPDLFAAAVKRGRAANLKPFLLISSSFDDGSTAIRKFRKKMPEAYDGVYIIEVMITDWENEAMEVLGFIGKFPYFAKIGTDNLPTEDIMTGDVWGEDTFENMQQPIHSFLQGHS